jgi:adenylyltransferase/sulfurtransferase
MKVLIPTPLRQYAEKKSTVEISATTVGEALAQLTQVHPELKKHLFNDAGQLRAFVNVYLNDEDVRYLAKDQTPVGATDTLSIVPSIAGGKIRVRCKG